MYMYAVLSRESIPSFYILICFGYPVGSPQQSFRLSFGASGTSEMRGDNAYDQLLIFVLVSFLLSLLLLDTYNFWNCPCSLARVDFHKYFEFSVMRFQ